MGRHVETNMFVGYIGRYVQQLVVNIFIYMVTDIKV